MAKLLSKSWIEQNLHALEKSQQEAFYEFANMIADKNNTYPCVPGRQGFVLDHLRFAFLGDPRESTTYQQMAEIIKVYGKCSRDTGKYASLVIIFDTPNDIKLEYNISDYEDLFWQVLSRVSELDEKEWPEGISKDPHHYSWEFCFDGEPYFGFCATPQHKLRKSRYFSHFLIAFQPRWVFDEINDSTTFGRKMKKLIRNRLQEYDALPVHPSLKWYGQKDNLEWKQYFLRDDETVPSKCPFSQFMNTLKKN